MGKNNHPQKSQIKKKNKHRKTPFSLESLQGPLTQHNPGSVSVWSVHGVRFVGIR